LLVLAEYAGLSVRSLPVIWTEDPDTKVNIPKTVWQDLEGVARLWWTARRMAEQWKEQDGGGVAIAKEDSGASQTANATTGFAQRGTLIGSQKKGFP
jgi:hypothetical protein